MCLEEKIKKVLEADFKQGVTKGSKKTEVYNPFGRSEPLTEFLKIQVSPSFKEKMRSLPNYAEVVRLVLEHDLETGQFPLRKPITLKTGMGAKSNNQEGATSQIGIRVSKILLEEIKQHKNWSAKAREALYEALTKINLSQE